MPKPGAWRNWYTRTVQNRIPQGLGVRVSPHPLMNQKFEAIFFDMDGLLVETEPLYYESAKEVYATAGIDLTYEWFVHEHLGKGRSVSELLREKGISEEKIVEIRKQRHKRYGEFLEAKAVTVDGAPEILEKLNGHFLLAVVTGSYREHFDIIMRRTGLQHYFDFFVTCEDTVAHKPDPAPYLRALELSQKDKEYCLVLEDSGNGSLAAKAAGLTCYAIPDEMTRSHDFSHADKILGSIREVPALVGI